MKKGIKRLKWSEKDIERIKKMITSASNKKELKKRLVKAFPDHSWDAIRRQMQRIQKRKIKKSDSNLQQEKKIVSPKLDKKTAEQGRELNKKDLDLAVKEAINKERLNEKDFDMAVQKAIAEERLKNIKRMQKALIAGKAKTEIVIEAIKNSIIALSPPKPMEIIIPSGKTSKEIAVLLFSDSQIGTLIDPEEAGLFGGYNMQIFSKQLKKLRREVIKIIARQRKVMKIPKLHIFLLGDIVENERIFRNQAHHIQTDIYNQWAFASREIANFINMISRQIPVECDCVFGNHGNMTNSKDVTKMYVNWDLLTYNSIQQYLRDNKRVTFKLTKQFWLFLMIATKGFYLTHGDNIIRYQKLPWYNATDTYLRNLALMQKVGNTMEFMCIGHHHSPIMYDQPTGEIICNGSFVSSNLYVLKKIKTTSRPTQMLFFVHPKVGITSRHLIRLEV